MNRGAINLNRRRENEKRFSDQFKVNHGQTAKIIIEKSKAKIKGANITMRISFFVSQRTVAASPDKYIERTTPRAMPKPTRLLDRLNDEE